MAGRMRMRARQNGDAVEVKVLMQHPMETGQRKDGSGAVIPAHYITEVTATSGDKMLLAAQWGPAVSQNPFLSFRTTQLKKGDSITVAWKDNKGETATTEGKVA